ncbi:MAG: hypothetical protein KBF66_04895 [Rhodoferax sp.]|uniref:hypothetical protein n=1 Tax=Rhodoferax sp. TaxID=50421 RepID=UPI001B6001A1|nr:hypothetical protein [Rhodoferax sp.]MBP9904873.1 hypothetical protein [Rhodoferax sp.]
MLTIRKAPEAANFGGQADGTTKQDSASPGQIPQDAGKTVATLMAKLALAGHTVHRSPDGGFTCCKFGLTRYCADFTAMVAFAKKVGAA